MAKNANSADHILHFKYGANFMLNVGTIEWLMVSSMISTTIRPKTETEA